MKKAKVINYVSDERDEYFRDGIKEGRKQERIATLEEVIKEFNSTCGAEYDENGDYLGEAIDVDKFGDWLEQRLKEAKGVD